MRLIKDLGVRSTLYIFLLYLCANILYLLNFDGVYWDDWVSYNQSQETLKIFYGEIMNTTHGYFSRVFHELGNGIYGFRMVFFTLYFFTGLMIIYVIKDISFFGRSIAYIVGLMYLLIPTFHVKVALSIIPFYVPVFLFFYAWYLLARHKLVMSRYQRLGILLLFFISFTTNSLLVVYAWVLMYIFYKQQVENNNNVTFQRITLFLRSNWDFIVLPIFFYIIKLLFLKPNGLYEGYNGLKVEALENVFPLFPGVFSAATFQQIGRSFENGWVVALIASFIAIAFARNLNNKPNDVLVLPNPRKIVILLLLGVVGVFMAVFPYLAVGKVPVVLGWNSRFLALSMLPSSMVLYALSCVFLVFMSIMLPARFNKKYFSSIIIGYFTFILTLFIVQGIIDQHRLNRDWFYQVGIQEQFKEDSVIMNNTTFVVDNKVRTSLAYQRYLVYYEWNGLLKKVFHDDTRLMIPPFYLARLKGMGTNQHYKQYNFSSWQLEAPNFITIDYGERMTYETMVKLYWLRLFDYERFKLLAKGLVKISHEYPKRIKL